MNKTNHNWSTYWFPKFITNALATKGNWFLNISY